MNTAAHVFRPRLNAARRAEGLVFWLFRGATYLILACGAAVFLNIVFKGAGTVFKTEAPFVNVAFLTEAPESLYIFEFEGKKYELGDTAFRAFKEANPAAANVKTESYVYSAGGIWPCIVGTVLLVVGSMTIALFLGVCAAVYLTEYARDGAFIRFVRLAILNLAGVPSIVFGLFGFGMFVIFFGWNVSLLAGWFTLAFMVLPVVITASEESLKSVPKGFREGSLALGATKWQTIRSNVLPYALPGILTSSILGIARVAGETAPIMFTAAYVVRDKLPWDVDKASDFFFQGVMALPYHIYVVSSKIPQNEYTERVQYGTAFVFLGIVALIAAASILLRTRLRNRYKW
ncbi:MAG: phosphate ABC transporter, permease protein PstA [Opitutia bacterium Tous-C1TDCM]|nr:MAG: phosphate ABC transporter, permease protein PstA [Opitutae bacterium Tous-C1TDCM]